MRLATSLVTSLLATSVALAAPALPGDKHEPPVWTDVTATWLQISPQSDESYSVGASFRIYGAKSSSDSLRIDIKQGAKVVGTASCRMSFQQNQFYGDCRTEKYLKTTGMHAYEVIYTDSATKTDYLVTTLKADVKRWKGIGKTIQWGYTPDDLLALGYLRHRDDGDAMIDFDFWTTADMTGSVVLRCTVDGKPIPDFEAESGHASFTATQYDIQSSWNTDKFDKVYNYRHINVTPKQTHYGPRPKTETGAQRFIIDNPGKWDCTVNVDDKPLRTFQFTVNDKGMVEPGELQSASKNVRLTPDLVLIDMRLPKKNVHEKRIRQDALKKSVGWGLPWPDSPKSKDAQAAFPASMGTPD